MEQVEEEQAEKEQMKEEEEEQNSRGKGTDDHYWPWAVFFLHLNT